MFKKILFATTASPTCDDAAKVAFDLSLKYESEEFYVFHVLGVPTRGFSPFVKDVRTGETEHSDQDYIQWVKDEMENTYGQLIDTVEKCDLETIVGIPHTEILRMDLISHVSLARIPCNELYISKRGLPGKPIISTVLLNSS